MLSLKLNRRDVNLRQAPLKSFSPKVISWRIKNPFVIALFRFLMGGDLGCEPPTASESGDLSPVPAPLWASFLYLQSCMVIPTSRMMVRIKQVTGSINRLLFLGRNLWLLKPISCIPALLEAWDNIKMAGFRPRCVGSGHWSSCTCCEPHSWPPGSWLGARLLCCSLGQQGLNCVAQWFSNGGDLSPPGGIWQCLETFRIITPWGWGCYWHLVGRGQGCC